MEQPESMMPVVTVESLRRTRRIGACPILTVTASYPKWQGESEAAERFNKGYLQMAEAFVTWAEKDLAPRAEVAFEALGSRAPYVFPKWEIIMDTQCFFEPLDVREGGDEPVRLQVVATVKRRARRSDTETCTEAFRHVWCLPDGYISPPVREKLSRLTKKGRKNSI